MNTTALEGFRSDADALCTVLGAAERIAGNDQGLGKLLAHARGLAEGLSNDIDVELETHAG